jgi:penicillin-binding protein 1A
MPPRRASTASRAPGGRWWSRHPRLVRGVLLALTTLVGAGAGAATGVWTLACAGGACPSASVLDAYRPRQTSKLYAADGRFLTELGLERRTLVPLKDIPPVVRDAFLTVEDKRFYEHHGVDYWRIGGSVWTNLRARGIAQGFSTITMQLARNVFPDRLTREKTLLRKVREVKVAFDIEAAYPKDKILELYLNQIYFGNGAYGVETAAQRYFGKPVRALNLAEAATLAALPKAPERYNPRRFPDRTVQRRNTIVELMRRANVVNEQDASLARAFPLKLARRADAGDLAPYFVEWVRQQLDQHFGKQLYEQGLKVYTTVDLDMQSAAERALERQLTAIEGGAYGAFPHPTYEQVNARMAPGDEDAASSPYLQGAFVAVDPRDGAVRAMVGGRDFDESKFNRATQALRQPGSTFKPIVYSTAIHAGKPPSYLVRDEPVNVLQENGQPWQPQNYDLTFQGPMTMRKGLTLSRNIVAIRVGQEVGPDAVVAMAHDFGLTTDIPPYPSIFIGASDVYPIEMIGAYTTFATLGIRSKPYAITKVESADGAVLWEPKPDRQPVLTPEEAWLMVSMMKDVVLRGTAFQSVYNAGFHFPSAGKTGTTNDGADVWYIGYTADLVAGTWIGFDRPQKIKANAQGGVLAAPAWTAFMSEVYQRRPAPPDWPRPRAITLREVDRRTGLLKGPACDPADVIVEYFLPGTEPAQACDPEAVRQAIADSVAASALGRAPTPKAAKPAAGTKP